MCEEEHYGRMVKPVKDKKIQALKETMDEEDFQGMKIPYYMQDPLAKYIVYGIPTGSFLEAVLTNNLIEAVARADNNNVRNIPAYISWLYNNAPMSCWGSVKRYRDWIEAHRGGKQDD